MFDFLELFANDLQLLVQFEGGVWERDKSQNPSGGARFARPINSAQGRCNLEGVALAIEKQIKARKSEDHQIKLTQ